MTGSQELIASSERLADLFDYLITLSAKLSFKRAQ